MKRLLAPLLVALALVSCSSGVSKEEYQKVVDENATLDNIIEFDRDVQVALAVYLNRNIAPEDRAFLCAVLHTKAAKTYFKCSP